MTAAQLEQIKKTSLARLVCDNSDAIDRVPANIFKMMHPDKMTECVNIPGMNMTVWREDPDAMTTIMANMMATSTQESPTTTA